MKKLLKSSLSLILAISFILSSAYVGLTELDFGNLFAVKASAADVDVLSFVLNDDGQSYAVSYCDYSVEGEVVIPSEYNGLPVTRIAAHSFYACYTLTSVVIPYGITSIEEYAFYDCQCLTSITIPNSVTSIGNYAFYGCTALASITVPDSVTDIGVEAFHCTAYYDNSANWINGILYIGNHFIEANNSCSGSLVIKDGTLSIPDDAFFNCQNITSVTIPDSVVSIGDFAFCQCTALTSVIIPGGVKSIGADAFSRCTSLTSITVPNGVESIGERAFQGCEYLSNVTIPSSVKSIGAAAFAECYTLTNVYISDVAAWCDIEFGDIDANPLGYAGYLYVNNKLITDLVVPEGVTEIPACAFSCENIKTVSIPNTVITIGECAFANCVGLTSIEIPNSVTSIGANTFRSCESLATITLGDGVSTIGDRAFYLCTALSEITIPASVTAIGNRAFLYCTNLTEVTIKGDKTTIGDFALGYKNEGTKINGFTIYGVKYTDVEQYAIDNEFTFVEIEGSHKHTISDWIIDVSATCSEEGSMHKECVFCKVVAESAVIPATGHNLDSNNKCANCGEQFGQPLRDYIIYVCDIETGGPVTGATVNLGGVIRTTDVTGAARYQLENDDTTTLSIVADTYPDYPESSYITGNRNVDYIYLTSDESDIYGAWCNEIDVINGSTQINAKVDSLVAEIVVAGRAKANILKYELIQDSVVIATSYTGSFSVPNKLFKLGQNKPVYVRMYTDGTEGNNVFERRLNIKVVGFVLNFVTDLKGILPFMNGITLSFSDEMPCFPGVEMKFPVPFAKNSEVSIYYDNDNVIVTYGFEKDFSPGPDPEDTPHNALLKLIRSYFKGKKNDKDNEVHASFGLVIEYDETGMTDIYGQINVGFHLLLNDGITRIFWGIPVRLEYEITASGEVTITDIKYDKTQHQLHANYEFPLEGGIAGLGGLGVEGITLGAYGKLGLKAEMDSDYVNDFKNLTIYGELGLYFKLKLGWFVNINKKIPLLEHDFYTQNGVLENTSALLYSLDSYEVDPREYLQNRTPWLNASTMSNGTYNVLLQDSTYNAIEPRIVTCGDTIMMLFLDDDGSTGYNYQHLYYSIYDKATGGWSEPCRVDNNNRCDAEFDVYSDGSSIYVAYTELDPIADGDQVDMDFIETSDVVVTQYSLSEGGFINHTNLTDNDSIDTSPRINETDDGIIVSWVNNCTNDIFLQNANNVVYFSFLNDNVWSEPVALTDKGATVVSMSIGSIGGKTYIAIINDDDCSLSTPNDRVLRLVDLNGNITEIATESDVNAAVKFVEINGENQLIWYNNQNLYHIGSTNDTPEYFFDSAISGLTDEYRFIQTDENSYAVLFTKNELIDNGEDEALDGSSLYGVFYNNGEWGQVVPVTANEAGYYVDAYDVCMYDGKMLIPYINSLVEIMETDISITSAFMSTTFSPKNDLVVGDVDCLSDELFNSTAMEIYVPVINNSWQSLSALSYEVRDSADNVIYSGTWEKYIESGSTEYFTIVIPNELLVVGENYSVYVNSSDWIDSDESNNVMSVPLWNTDFSVSASQLALVGRHEVQYTVTNNGNIGSAAILKVYKVSDDGTQILISENEVSYLDAGASVSGVLSVTDEYYFDGSDTGTIVLEVVYDGEEMFVFNDYVTLTIGGIERDETTAADGSSTVFVGPVIANSSVTYDKADGTDVLVTVTENDWIFAGVAELSTGDYSYGDGVLTISRTYLSTLAEGDYAFTLSYSNSDLTTEVLCIVKVTDTSYKSVNIVAENREIRYDGYPLELGKDILYYTESEGTVTTEYSVDNGATWSEGLPSEIGEYLVRITVAQDDENRLLSASCTVTVTIKKSVRAISVPMVTGTYDLQVLFGNAVPTAGKTDGTILYGYSLTNDVETVTEWSESGVLPQVDVSTTYYIFAKIVNGEKYDDAYSIGYAVDAYVLRHFSSEWIIDLAATCTEEGSKHKECTECGEVLEVAEIAPLGHDYEAISIAQEHPHGTIYECSRCDSTTEDEHYFVNCVLCNFTFTNIDDNSCRITGYIGKETSIKLPGFVLDRVVVNTTNGAFKNNTTLKSVIIEDGVRGIGSMAFFGCVSLSEIVIPASVTSIGAKAFYNCASDFTIYCFRDTYAMQYAIDNSHNYVIMDIGETENCTIDYEDDLIFSSAHCMTSLEDLIYVPSTSLAFVEASVISGNHEFFGTGSLVTVFDGDNVAEYTIIVDGDTNGDSVCDALDAAQVALASSGQGSFDGVYALAADRNSDDVVDIADYQAIVNKTIA